MADKMPDYFAAIHLGSEQVSMQIVEYTSLQNMKVIDRASRAVDLGEEAFQTNKISFGTLNEVCELLKGYRRMLAEYGVRDYRLIATTAVREAENQKYIIDQIKVKTGLDVKVVDVPQEIFYKYVSSYKKLAEQDFLEAKKAVLFVDISSGGLGMTLWQDGAIKYQQNLKMGALRIKESFSAAQRDSLYFHQALEEFIYAAIEPVKAYLGHVDIDYLCLSGRETELLLKMLGKTWGEVEACPVSLSEFRALYEKIKRLNLSQLQQIFSLSPDDAAMVLPTLVLYHQILSLTTIEQIVIPCDQFMDGITLLYLAGKHQDPWLQTMEDQVFSLIRTLGKRYQYDKRHSQAVEQFSLLIFDRMARIHGLGNRERLLLQGAAILHDIGKFVSLRSHPYYSYRLICSSDILGLSEKEKAVMANVAYYHSQGIPDNHHYNYSILTKKSQVTVAKLSAILRLADAMDRSHRQKAIAAAAVFKNNELNIQVKVNEDYSLEEWTFADKADFFEDVFGIRANLERVEKIYV
ncbi:MAG: HD domain-containing protein [Sporomusaceae bacterium]|nr:HD domain-containing protein [Sporomusaceae bacterium]